MERLIRVVLCFVIIVVLAKSVHGEQQLQSQVVKAE
ncbi:MAG: hypothetical protein FD151_633, partial [bacterium]